MLLEYFVSREIRIWRQKYEIKNALSNVAIRNFKNFYKLMDSYKIR